MMHRLFRKAFTGANKTCQRREIASDQLRTTAWFGRKEHADESGCTRTGNRRWGSVGGAALVIVGWLVARGAAITFGWWQ